MAEIRLAYQRREAAEMLSIDPTTLDKRVREGKIKKHPDGLFTLKELERYLDGGCTGKSYRERVLEQENVRLVTELERIKSALREALSI